jgi:hypothetical protein
MLSKTIIKNNVQFISAKYTEPFSLNDNLPFIKVKIFCRPFLSQKLTILAEKREFLFKKSHSVHVDCFYGKNQ